MGHVRPDGVRVLPLLVAVVIGASLPSRATAETDGAAPAVQVHGSVHEMMHGDAAPAVTLAPSALGPKTFGLGALAGHRGELTIVGGRAWVSSAGPEGHETTVGIGDGLELGLLAMAEVDSWNEGVTTGKTNLAGLADQVRAHGTRVGLAPDELLVFRLVGKWPHLRGHVLDASGLKPELTAAERHDRAVSRKSFRGREGVIIGFVSSRHEGVLTHAGDTIHAHAVLHGDEVTVHVEEVRVPAGSRFELGLRDLTAREWMIRAYQQHQAGAFDESARSYARSIAAGAKNPTIFYNAACSAALAGSSDDAFRHLDGALERGFRNVTLMLDDGDLSSLHDDPRWPTLIARTRAAEETYTASLGAPELRDELLEMRRIDQAVRRGEPLPELEGRNMMDVDAVHTARMKEIVAEHGWPVPSLVGEDGARTAWLLVQHADLDPPFQRHCLELMKQLPPDQVSAVDVAYLTDRVLVNEGKEQVYGTQFWMVDGELVPRPIEDEAGVEARRAAAGMISLREYTEQVTGRR